MADDIQVPEQPQTPSVSPEIAQLMQLSLNGGIAPQTTDPSTPTDATTVPATDTPPDIFAPFKEKFGYQSPEDAIKEIEELRLYKAKPTAAEVKFENEQSEKLFNAFKQGKDSEVYEYLAQQHKLNSLTTADVTKDNAADIIKLGMSLKHKDLTDAEITYQFNKRFALPKSPVQETDEDDTDFANRKAEWQDQMTDIEMGKIIEAKMIRPELETAKSKIVLPEINATVDEGYFQYLKRLDEQPEKDAAIAEAYKAFTPKSIETKMPFTDEANKIAFEFQYEPDVESFNKSVGMVTDVNNFFNCFINQDGTPNRKEFIEAIHFAMNSKKIIMEAMKQAKNATIKSFLPDNNSMPGGQRMSPQTQEPSELDKQMRNSLAPYSR